jgi:hypothetical protein
MNRLLLAATVLAGVGGCMRGPAGDPLLARADPFDTSNQILLTPANPGPEAYAEVFEKVYDAIDDVFDVAYASRYDGRIETHPRVAPGLEQLFKPGSPDAYERTLATIQSYRHRAFVLIQPDRDGYVVSVTVFKELEDIPHPSRDAGGGAAFRSDNTVERTYEIIDPSVISWSWVPKGRDYALEQKLLRKIKRQFDQR